MPTANQLQTQFPEKKSKRCLFAILATRSAAIFTYTLQSATAVNGLTKNALVRDWTSETGHKRRILINLLFERCKFAAQSNERHAFDTHRTFCQMEKGNLRSNNNQKKNADTDFSRSATFWNSTARHGGWLHYLGTEFKLQTATLTNGRRGPSRRRQTEGWMAVGFGRRREDRSRRMRGERARQTTRAAKLLYTKRVLRRERGLYC